MKGLTTFVTFFTKPAGWLDALNAWSRKLLISTLTFFLSGL